MGTDRQKSSDSVQAACTTHRDAMAQGLASTLDDLSLATHVTAIIDKAALRLGQHKQAMVDADDENIREKGEDTTARENHHAAVATLRQNLVDLRSAVAEVLGDEAVRTLGYDGATPKDDVQLERLAASVIKSLSKLTMEPRIPGFSFNPAPWQARIEERADAVASTRSLLATEVRETEGTQTNKDKAREQYDQTFSRVATLASALLAIAGERELAGRVRPSRRRPGQTADDANDPTEPEEPIS